jgi:uncharacterized membrane protein YozB (DUF420 family)
MKGSRPVLRRWEAHALLSCLFLVLYTWPLVTSSIQGRAGFVFVYYYAVFAVHVVVLALVSGSVGDGSAGNGGARDG